MALAASNSDIVGCIILYLDGMDVIRLLECGDPLLSAKISQTCREFRVLTRPFQKFPFTAFRLPHLNCLIAFSLSSGHLYPLRLKGMLPLPEVPVKSLVKLELSFGQSFSVLQLVDGVPILDTLLPNLKTLHLAGSLVLLHEDHMKAVPRGLNYLHLDSRYASLQEAPILLSAFQNLPPALDYLHVYAGPIATDIDSLDYSTLQWPPKLTHLYLRLVYPVILLHLPPHIENLSLTLLPSRGRRQEGPIPTSIFPVSLTTLSISSASFEGRLKFRPTTFPPNLTYCWLSFDYSFSQPSDWVHLPKSLTECCVSPKFHRIGRLADMLPNLTQFMTIDNMEAYPPGFLDTLPPTLKLLDGMTVPLAQTPNISEKLEGMSASVTPLSLASSSSERPSEEFSSSESGLIRGDMSRLPRNLAVLDLQSAVVLTKFEKVDFDLLPRTLQEISLDLKDVENANTLLGLPNTLNTINIKISENSSSDLICDSQLFDKLPSALKHISIFMDPIETAWTLWMLSLHRYPSLVSLFVTFNDFDSRIDPISLDFLPSLPKTIVELHLPLCQTHLTPELIKALPPNLESLWLHSMPFQGSINYATDECFANLPKTLSRLHVALDTKGLTNGLLQILPSTLVSLTLPKQFTPLLVEYFAREPEWDGFKPSGNY